MLALGFLVITRQLLQLERCSNPQQMREDFWFYQKKNFDSGEGFAWDGLAKWGRFCFFDQF